MPISKMARTCPGVAAMLLLTLACESGGDGRFLSEGSATNAKAGADAGGGGADAGGDADGGDDTVGGDDGGSGSSSIPNGKSLEQCTEEGKAWRAVVNNGNDPADCTDPLVSWCCTRENISKYFPSMASQVEQRFEQFIDTDGHVLYHCSENAADKKFTFHMAKISGGTTSYKTVFVSDLNPQGVTAGETCTQVTTSQLIKDGGTVDGTDTDTDSGTALTFDADVKPVLQGKCAGSGCHDDGGSLDASSQWINDETKFKASDTAARVAATVNPMPPDASPALTDDEKAKLLEFLGQ